MKSLLLIVDFQDIFAKGDVGSDLECRIENRILSYLNDNNDIAFTIDKAGAGLYGKIEKYTEDAVRIFEKHAYGSLDFGNWLSGQNYGKVEVCGLLSNVCVLANAVIARSALPNSDIVVDKGLTACCDNKLGRR